LHLVVGIVHGAEEDKGDSASANQRQHFFHGNPTHCTELVGAPSGRRYYNTWTGVP
jgi:hypothetical protein